MLTDATIAYGTATGHCQMLQAGTTSVSFQSATYSDMRQLLAREAKVGAVTVKATLGFPEQVKDRYPAVIIVPCTLRLTDKGVASR